MITDKELILLSILSYCNFGEEEYGKNIWDIFHSPKANKIIIGTFDILISENRNILFEYFEDELKRWKVFLVDNKTVTGQDSYKASGFYSVCFENSSKYIVAYRGSEKYPLEDAYKDFIQTDLAIGMGKIPEQFYEGIDIYNRLTKEIKINREDIIFTGHSLGGGIAQYVALTLDKTENYIPKVYSWNGVGINREGIVNILEFIDLKKILKLHTSLTKEEIKKFDDFNKSYLEFMLKELKSLKVIKDSVTYLYEEHQKVIFDIDEDFVKRLIKNTNIEECLKKFDFERRKEILIKDKLIIKLFRIPNLNKLLLRAKYLINKVHKNIAYQKNVKNYGHSQDLTNSLFRHLGSSYLIDKDFVKNQYKYNSFFSKFKIFTKSIQDRHFEDVFIAFIDDKTNNFSLELNDIFIASVIRHIINLEKNLSNFVLVKFYSLAELTEDNYIDIRNDLLKSLTKNDKNLLYKYKIINELKEMDYKRFSKIWKISLTKLVSPYKKQDLFDIFVFR